MKVISFFLCDRAVQNVPGTYDLYGFWWHTYRVIKLPLSTNVVVFVHLLFEESEIGVHALTVKAMGANKSIVAMVHAPVTIGKMNLEFAIPIVLGPIAVTQTGRYCLELEIDQEKRHEREIVVEVVQQAQS